MKSSNTILSIVTLFTLVFSTLPSEAQVTNPLLSKSNESGIEVIQFHSEHRCMTCNKIETYAKESAKEYGNIPFSLVNVDDKKNEKMAEKFEATGTALWLYNSKTGKKKDLTDFAFMNAGNKEKFLSGLKKELSKFAE